MQRAESENASGAEMNQTTGGGLCYCNKGRDFHMIELLCANCDVWFHKPCIEYELENLVPFMLNYIFICKNCSPTGHEDFNKNPATIVQMCITAIGNLMLRSINSGENQEFFSRDDDIAPFIIKNWEVITTTAKRATQSRNSSIKKILTKETGVLFGVKNSDGNQLYKLLLDLSEIKPNYGSMVKNGLLKVSTENGNQSVVINIGAKGHGAKRKSVIEPGSDFSNTSRMDNSANGQSSYSHGYPLDHPFNKKGFKYILAELDPHVPKEVDKEILYTGKVIPTWLYRTSCPNEVLLSLHDCAPQLHISEDRLSVTGEKGYSMVRATHSVSSGNWYFEVTIKDMPKNSACRIGWSQEFATLEAPLGFDKFGYSWRSRKGTVFHESRGKHFSDSFGKGDILGLMICLPDDTPSLPSSNKDLLMIKFKNHLYYKENIGDGSDDDDDDDDTEPLIGSKIIFYKNGECLNVGASNINIGQYFPTLSLYKNCTLSVNFGPDFEHPPPETDDFKYKGMWEKANESVCEHALSDIIYLIENEDRY